MARRRVDGKTGNFGVWNADRALADTLDAAIPDQQPGAPVGVATCCPKRPAPGRPPKRAS
jgi:hypothetical protein